MEELQQLEDLVSQLLTLADQGRIELTLYDGNGEGRHYDRRARHRFWRRRVPLVSTLPLSTRA